MSNCSIINSEYPIFGCSSQLLTTHSLKGGQKYVSISKTWQLKTERGNGY